MRLAKGEKAVLGTPTSSSMCKQKVVHVLHATQNCCTRHVAIKVAIVNFGLREVRTSNCKSIVNDCDGQ